jgi:hypothetical protein
VPLLIQGCAATIAPARTCSVCRIAVSRAALAAFSALISRFASAKACSDQPDKSALQIGHYAYGHMSANPTNSGHHLLTKEQLANYDQYLLDKVQLAEHLGMKVRGVEMLVKERKIPAMRIGHKTLRFSLPRVMRALEKFEVREVEKK